jgi:L-lysine 2,3-aminomutase
MNPGLFATVSLTFAYILKVFQTMYILIYVQECNFACRYAVRRSYRGS